MTLSWSLAPSQPTKSRSLLDFTARLNNRWLYSSTESVLVLIRIVVDDSQSPMLRGRSVDVDVDVWQCKNSIATAEGHGRQVEMTRELEIIVQYIEKQT